MAYMKKNVEELGLIRLNDLPSEWNVLDRGQWYQLSLRMFNLRSIDDLFDHSHSSERSAHIARSDRILEMDVSLNGLVSLESHQLQKFSQLRKLIASLNQISRYHGVDALKNLNFIDLSHNRIKFVASQLVECQYLRVLNLAVNEIEDLLSLPTFSCIYTLFIDHNQLKSLGGISSFPAVRELHIHHNHLTDISPLSACTQLAVLDASDNNISKLSVVMDTLVRLKMLKNVALLNNPVAREPMYRSSLSSLYSLEVLDNFRVDPADARHVQFPPDSRPQSWNHAMYPVPAKTPNLAAATAAPKPVNMNVIQLQYPLLSTASAGMAPKARKDEHSVELARQAYHQHLLEKKRQKDDTVRYLARQMQMVEDEFKEYEEKSLSEMNSCIKHLSAAKESQPPALPINYFQNMLTSSTSSDDKTNWAPIVFTTKGKPVEVIMANGHHQGSSDYAVPIALTKNHLPTASTLPLPDRRIRTTDYRDVKETDEDWDVEDMIRNRLRVRSGIRKKDIGSDVILK